MKKDILVSINTETSKIINNSACTVGVKSENLQANLIIKPIPFVNGAGRFYVENQGSIKMKKQEDCYILPIKSSLLKNGDFNFCFKVTEPENEGETPIFVSEICDFKVLDTIESEEEIPDQYPSWIETFDSKIAELEELEENIEQAEANRENAERERNTRVDEAIENIVDLTEEYNQNAVEKTNEFNMNVTEKTDDFNNNADEKKEELEVIADGVKDMATAIQFATFEVDNDMNLVINQAEKLVNTNFSINEGGELEVEIVHG